MSVALVVAGLAVVGLSGCAALLLIPSAGTSSGSSGGSGGPAPIQAYSDGSTSARNNISKAIGERAGEKNFDGTKRLDTFVVTRIVVDPVCVNAATPPANGHYLEVDMTVTSTDAMGQAGANASLDLSPANWNYYPTGDDTGVVASSAGDDCQVAVPALTPVVGPSTTTTGSIVLDVNDDSRWIALVPYSNGPGWEWPYTAPAS